MNIKPLGDHILIEPIKEEEKTKAGIFLPDTASKEKSEEGNFSSDVFDLEKVMKSLQQFQAERKKAFKRA